MKDAATEFSNDAADLQADFQGLLSKFDDVRGFL